MMEKQASPNSSRILQWDLCVGLLPLIALAPMLLHEIAALGARPHMRFFPLTLLAVAGILAYNWRKAEGTALGGRRQAAIGLFILSMAVFLYSVWEFSPWLSHLALVLSFAAWALGRFGNTHWGIVTGWAILLASTLPLPWGWDLGLLYWLQGISTWATTCALDALGIACLQNGNLLEIRGLAIFAEEVCDGWGSLYAYLSLAMILLALQNRGLVVSLKVLCLVPVWSVLANFLRLLTITTMHEYYGLQLASGRDFLLLQLATVLISLGLIWLSSIFFNRLYEPVPVVDAEFGPVFSALNKLFHWPMPDPLEMVQPEDPDDLKQFLHRQKLKEEESRQRPTFEWTKNPLCLWSVRGAAIAMLVAGLLPVAGVAGPALSSLRFTRPSITPAVIENTFNETSLPESIGEQWQRIDYLPQRQSAANPLGQYHLAWVYKDKQRQFIASIKLPVLGWQDPIARLVRSGWQADRIRLSWQDDWPWVEAELENELGGKAYLFYCLTTNDGRPFTNVPNSLEAIAVSEPPPEIDLTAENSVAQVFELFVETGQELSEPELLEYRGHFMDLRKIALQLQPAN